MKTRANDHSEAIRGGQNYIRLFYVELAFMIAIALIYAATRGILVAEATTHCSDTAWKIVPYIALNADDICKANSNIPAIAIYYIASLVVIIVFQVMYLIGRSRLSIVAYPQFLIVAVLLGMLFTAWITGNDDINNLFSFRVHQSSGWGLFLAPIIIPSLQFMLSVLMLQEKE